MYLEPIFSAPDIQKQLPAESKAFDLVHRQLKDVMRRTKDRPNALQTAGNPSEPPATPGRATSVRVSAAALSCPRFTQRWSHSIGQAACTNLLDQ
jgi:hypothetical protein